MKAAQPDSEKIQEDMRALSKINEEMSKLLDENHKAEVLAAFAAHKDEVTAGYVAKHG